MNLYRSKPAEEPLVWTGTQIDAREAHGGAKDFEHHDVPTDKAGLMALLNDYERRVFEAGQDMAPPSPVAAEDMAVSSPAPTDPGDCPACHRSARVARTIANATAASSIKADLSDITDIEVIDRVFLAVEARRQALHAAA